MSNWSFVGLSFGLTWVVLLGYTLTVLRRARRARAALDAAIRAERDAAAARAPEAVPSLTPVEVA